MTMQNCNLALLGATGAGGAGSRAGMKGKRPISMTTRRWRAGSVDRTVKRRLPSETMTRMSLRKPAIAVAFSLATVAAGLVVSSPAAPARAAASACTVAYSVTSSWQGGFQGGITITNNGPAITSWTLDFAFPLNDQAINSGWGGTYTQNGRSVSTTSASYDGALGTGASTTIGFIAAGPATGTPPGFFVNGFACNGAAQVPDVKNTSPAAYANFTPGQDITIAAPTIEPASTIAKVEYFAN